MPDMRKNVGIWHTFRTDRSEAQTTKHETIRKASFYRSIIL